MYPSPRRSACAGLDPVPGSSGLFSDGGILDPGLRRDDGLLMRLMTGMVLLFLAMTVGSAVQAADHTLKFATLAPPGSTWMNLLEDWGREVEQRSGGRLELKFYPGGVQGDEPDVLRKIRYRQLDGAALTGYGIGSIHSPARVLEFPFLFDSHEEIDHVRAELMPEIEEGFRAGGYELLGWMEVGFVYFFSQHRIDSFEDLQERRIWLWQGDPLGQAMFRAGDLAPVPLSITDVYTSLSTGLIDTVYCTPLAAIALQWHTRLDYMSQLPMANGIGALVVASRFFDQLPPDLRQLLRETGAQASRELIRATREDNATSLDVLREEGMEFVMPPESLDRDALLALRDQAAARLTEDSYIPRSLYERTRELLTEYRVQDDDPAVTDNGKHD
ncbi:TRAP transporter substrate-binding protein [Thiohalobacter thiocyanaticus]|uniref:TRAP transporter substrate-binding protein n=1 Tax=Thiohalobacter thiocyanaticus TaxID=585455 RepID=UPI001319B8BF|nr:TRAP transporter substrate-binding protein DctP [Thiohalobacter thiocyanaticus]